MANELFCSFCGKDIDTPHTEGCVQSDATIGQVTLTPLVITNPGTMLEKVQRGIVASGGRLGQGEIRVVDEKTGGEKGMKLARFSLIPPDFVWELAEHYGKGAFKYADRNWEKGYKWSLSLDSSQRHLHQWLQGEDLDEETGSSHLIAAIWHLVALWWFHKFNKGTNDIR